MCDMKVVSDGGYKGKMWMYYMTRVYRRGEISLHEAQVSCIFGPCLLCDEENPMGSSNLL